MILVIWPDFNKIKTWPSIWVKNLVQWLKENNQKFLYISWLSLKVILKLASIFFIKKIYINWIKNINLLFYLLKIFKYKKFIVWPDFEYDNKIFNFDNCLFLVPGS